eukprot:gene57200-biopygen46591
MVHLPAPPAATTVPSSAYVSHHRPPKTEPTGRSGQNRRWVALSAMVRGWCRTAADAYPADISVTDGVESANVCKEMCEAHPTCGYVGSCLVVVMDGAVGFDRESGCGSSTHCYSDWDERGDYRETARESDVGRPDQAVRDITSGMAGVSYTDDARCDFRPLIASRLRVMDFHTEEEWDMISIGGSPCVPRTLSVWRRMHGGLCWQWTTQEYVNISAFAGDVGTGHGMSPALRNTPSADCAWLRIAKALRNYSPASLQPCARRIPQAWQCMCDGYFCSGSSAERPRQHISADVCGASYGMLRACRSTASAVHA